jgi:4'-phosphopantetheinyl transferase
MIEIWSVNIEHLPFTLMQQLLNDYPDSFQQEVSRYRQMDDQKRKLLGRQLIQLYLKKKNYPFSVNDIKFDQNKKPYIENGPFFNISHSGSYVVVAFGKAPVGIDIEEEKEVDVQSLSSVFHAAERSFVKASNYQHIIFYKLWARKEACLKAVGIGIINGLDQLNVLNDLIVVSGKEWSIREVSIADGYQCAVCFENSSLRIVTKEIDVAEFISACGL